MNLRAPKTVAFLQDFRDVMYDNMWTFMNTDVISSILKSTGINTGVKTTRKYIDFTNQKVTDPKLQNCICFSKFNQEEGHYYYVDRDLVKWGTFECGLLTREDDNGVCHAAAIIFAANLSDSPGLKFPTLNIEPPSMKNKGNNDIMRNNYISMLRVYKYIIESGYWDNAIFTYFEPDFKESDIVSANWGMSTRQTLNALSAINTYIGYLERIKLKK